MARIGYVISSCSVGRLEAELKVKGALSAIMVGLVSFCNQAKLFRKIGSAGAYPQLLFTVDNKTTGNLVDVVVVVMS